MVRRTEKGDATSSWEMEKDVSGGESEWIVGWTGFRRVWCEMSSLVWVERRCESREGMKETRCGGHLAIYSVSIVFGFAGVGGRSLVGSRRRSPRSPSLARHSSNCYLFLVSFLTVLPTSELRGSSRGTRDARPIPNLPLANDHKLYALRSAVFAQHHTRSGLRHRTWCASLLILPLVVLCYFYRPGCQMITIFLRALFPEHLQLPNDMASCDGATPSRTTPLARLGGRIPRAAFRISHMRASFTEGTINETYDSVEDPDRREWHFLYSGAFSGDGRWGRDWGSCCAWLTVPRTSHRCMAHKP